MNQQQILELSKGFIDELISLSGTGDILPLLSPENVMISETKISLKNTAVAPPTGAPLAIFPGYSAPEAYNGGQTPATPVYFVGALMFTLAAGMPPADSLSRMQAPGLLVTDGSPFANVVNAATEVDATRRTGSLQLLQAAVATALGEAAPPAANAAFTPPPAAFEPPPPAPQPAETAAYTPPTTSAAAEATEGFTPQQETGPAYTPPTTAANPQPASSDTGFQPPAPVPSSKPPKKGKKKALIIVIITVFLLAALAAGFFIFTNMRTKKAKEAYAAQNYTEVVSLIDGTPWIKKANTEIYNYAQAHVLYEEGKLEESLALFEELGDFEDSASQVKAVKYDMAKDLLENKKLEESLALFKELGSYNDSADIAYDIALYLEAENAEDPMERYNTYRLLDGFLDSEEKMLSLSADLYNAGIALYNNAEYLDALPYFELLEDYEKASLYAEACDLSEPFLFFSSLNKEGYERLIVLSEDIDVSNILLKPGYLDQYLLGTWHSADGGGRFQWEENLYRFESFETPARVYLDHGALCDSSDDSVVATFEFVSKNEVKITIEGGTYTFTRG